MSFCFAVTRRLNDCVCMSIEHFDFLLTWNTFQVDFIRQQSVGGRCAGRLKLLPLFACKG